MEFFKKSWWVLLLVLIIVSGGIYYYAKFSNRPQNIENTKSQTQAFPETWVKNPEIFLKETTSSSTISLKDGTYRMYLMSDAGISYLESSDGKTFGQMIPTGIS